MVTDRLEKKLVEKLQIHPHSIERLELRHISRGDGRTPEDIAVRHSAVGRDVPSAEQVAVMFATALKMMHG